MLADSKGLGMEGGIATLMEKKVASIIPLLVPTRSAGT